MPNSKFTHVVVAIAVIAAGLFGADFIINGYDKELGRASQGTQGSLLGLDTQNLEREADNVIDTQEDLPNVTQDTNDVVVNVETVDLSEKTLITESILADAGISGGRIESLKKVDKLFGYFVLNQIQASTLIKKAIYNGQGEVVAHIYQFPAEAYALGLDWNKASTQIKNQMTDGYTLHEPSSFGPLSFYITANNPENTKVTALAQLNGTLLGFEYDKSTYSQVQNIIDTILNQN